MALINFSNVSKFYGDQDILADVTFSIKSNNKIGLVGRNGAGKSTIIKLIMGLEEINCGLISKGQGLRLGYLAQELSSESQDSLLETTMDTKGELQGIENDLQLIEHELLNNLESKSTDELVDLTNRQSHLLHLFETLGGWEREAKAKKILTGLGFSDKDFDRGFNEFSGGWMMRGILARLLLSDPDLLILDEPTNHLDITSLMWLEDYLKTTESSVLLVSHDRIFLNSIVNNIMEVRQGNVTLYHGNYNYYLKEKAERLTSEVAAYENQQEKIKQIEDFIEKNKARASTAKRAQSRQKQLDKLDVLKAPERETQASFGFRLPSPKRGPDVLAQFQNIDKSYGPLNLFNGLDYTLARGSRLAIIGPNGKGKSTFLKMLAGLEMPDKGTAKLSEGVIKGYFAQFQLDDLNLENTVLKELSAVAGDATQGAIRSTLGSFLFSGDDVFKLVKVLSGGEKARLALAKIMLQAPNLLLFDEPTNHLDIPARQMLETALKNYEGSIVLISHDRQFINNICTEIAVIEEGKLLIYPGNFDDYKNIWLKKINPENTEVSIKKEEIKSSSGNKVSRDERKRAEAKERQRLYNLANPLEDKIKKTEKSLATLQARKKEITTTLAQPETYQNANLVKNLNLEFSDLAEKIKKLEEKWEKHMLALEELKLKN